MTHAQRILDTLKEGVEDEDVCDETKEQLKERIEELEAEEEEERE